MAEGYSYSGELFDYYQPNPGSPWNSNGEYFEDTMACSIWTNGYKLRVKDVQEDVLPGVCNISNSAFSGVCNTSNSAFPLVFLVRFLFPWLQENL